MVLNLFYCEPDKDVYAVMARDYVGQVFVWNRLDKPLDINGDEEPVFIRYYLWEENGFEKTHLFSQKGYRPVKKKYYAIRGKAAKVFQEKCEKAVLRYLEKENEDTVGYKGYYDFVNSKN